MGDDSEDEEMLSETRQDTPSKRKRRAAASEEAAAVLVPESVPVPLTVDEGRYRHFMELLNKLVTEKFQAQELEISSIRKFFSKEEKKNPFSNDEIDACLERMSDETKVMRSEDVVYII